RRGGGREKGKSTTGKGGAQQPGVAFFRRKAPRRCRRADARASEPGTSHGCAQRRGTDGEDRGRAGSFRRGQNRGHSLGRGSGSSRRAGGSRYRVDRGGSEVATSTVPGSRTT